MFEKLTSADSRDFATRYEGTYGFFTTERGSRLLVQLTRIDQDILPVVVHFQDKDKLTYHFVADSDHGFEFIPPKSAWYNTQQGAVFTYRHAQRQWSRGISRKNTSIQLLIAGTLTSQPVDFTWLLEIFTPPASITQEVALEKGFSWALSPQIALDNFLKRVYVFNEPVGSFRKVGEVYHVALIQGALWGTEVTDAFRRNGIPLVLKETL